MATRTITIKDAYVPEMIEVFGERWPAQILDVDGETLIDNPQSKANFAGERFDREIKEYIHTRVKSYRMQNALDSLDNTEILE
jgi:hypothetical protein